MPPPKGSVVRLSGLKDPSINGSKGTILGYYPGKTRKDDRLIVGLNNSNEMVKIKPAHMEMLQPARRHYRSSRRSSSRRASWSASHDDAAQELLDLLKTADALFELADQSGDGYVSQKEFELYMQRHTNHSPELIRDVFYMMDRDGDGEVSKEEVRYAFLKKRREVMGSQSVVGDDVLLSALRDADLLFDKADVSGDGALSKREFELYMRRHTKHSDAAISELFSLMDDDDDGMITRDEVRMVFLREKQQHKTNGEDGGKLSMADMLGLNEDDLHELPDDVYSMMFLAPESSQAFWYAIFVFLLKQSLTTIIAIDLFVNKTFPSSDEVSTSVRVAQFLLLAVNCAVQEELVITFFIYANLKWSRSIMDLNPGATFGKYHASNMARLSDGLSFLLVNTTVMFQQVDVLNMFLCFAALQFLQSLDNVALELARKGTLSEMLQSVAMDVDL
jgi:Ca2+-binding EF-hand superfamily protein